MFYVLECSVKGCNAEFYLNDIPIVRRGPVYGTAYSGPVNPFLVDGVNALEIVVNPGPTPGEAVAGPSGERRRLLAGAGAFARAKLARYPFGAVVDGPDREQLSAIEWEVARPSVPEMFPQVASRSVDLGGLFGPWAWQSAPPVELDDATVAEIHGFIEKFHANRAAGDADYFITASRMRIADLDTAYNSPPGKREADIRYMTAVSSRKPGWGLEPLEPAQYDLRLCAQGRMVECISKRWLPVVAETPDPEGSVIRYPMLIAKMADTWQIVR